MTDPVIRFDDGAAYEKFMGIWSRIAGDVFIDWLAPAKGLKWVDVGCGNGAFTENIVDRCAPAEVQGIDPSEGQLAFARTRPAEKLAKFQQGDAMALPFADSSFDVAVMALVIFFVPEPAKGVAELARVTKPGGLVATYAWDVLGGGFPMEPLQAAMREMGVTPVLPPRADASRIDALIQLWNGAGIEAVETREIVVQRTYGDFEEFWAITQLSAAIAPIVAKMPVPELDSLKAMVKARLPAGSSGRITYSARANAIKGRKPL
ncbi:MAG: class I SAM-dependent methyltransferase [Pseudolabrys sp.]|nr:class I SAM-dependent methyltransferase [Pseudolabrys sp.]